MSRSCFFMRSLGVIPHQGYIVKGKKSALGKLLKCEATLQAESTGFLLENQTRTMIAQLGSKAMVCLFGGSAGASLAELRLEMFTKKVVTAKSFVTPERLPPTSSAARFHSLRVYYQLMVWSGLDGGMHAVDWGWHEHDGRLVPTMLDGQAAPDDLLKVVHCNCKAGCKTMRCGCRRYGLPMHSSLWRLPTVRV